MYEIKKRYILFVAILILPIVLISLPDSYVEPLKLQVTRFLKPPLIQIVYISQKIEDVISLKGFFSRQLKNKDLQIDNLKAENARLKELLLENQRLKGLLEFKQSLNFYTIPARIIAKDPTNWRNSIIIDKGYNSGIKKNMYLISSQGLVGRICEVGRSLSKAILLTDPDFKVAAICQRNREEMIIVGSGRRQCNMKYLSQDADIQEKDIILTSGVGGFCPKGILIGEVSGVSKSRNGFTIEAFLKPAVKLGQLEEVLVLEER